MLHDLVVIAGYTVFGVVLVLLSLYLVYEVAMLLDVLIAGFREWRFRRGRK